MNKILENDKRIKNMTFTQNLNEILRNRTGDSQKSVLLAAVNSPKVKNMENMQKIYEVNEIGKICPLYLIEYSY